MEAGTMNGEELAKVLVLEMRVASVMLEAPEEYNEARTVIGIEPVEFIDMLQVEFKNIEEKVVTMMFEFEEAADLYVSLREWIANMHQMGRCRCEDGEHEGVQD